MQKLAIFCLLLSLVSSCEKQTDWDLQTGNMDLLVVDGIITNEFKLQTITITRPVSGINDTPEPVRGATVLVSSDQLAHTFVEDSLHPGRYASEKPFKGIAKKTYSLLITSGNQVYSSKAELAPPAGNFDFIRYQKGESDHKYHFTRVPTQYSPVLPARYEIQLDWSKVPGYENENPDLCRMTVYYYTLPTMDVSEVFAPGTENITFPAGTVLTERRYSLTDEHAAFIRALLLETTWQGGYFNTASANIPTNLSTGAIGFFGACGVLQKQEIAGL